MKRTGRGGLSTYGKVRVKTGTCEVKASDFLYNYNKINMMRGFVEIIYCVNFLLIRFEPNFIVQDQLTKDR